MTLSSPLPISQGAGSARGKADACPETRCKVPRKCPGPSIWERQAQEQPLSATHPAQGTMAFDQGPHALCVAGECLLGWRLPCMELRGGLPAARTSKGRPGAARQPQLCPEPSSDGQLNYLLIINVLTSKARAAGSVSHPGLSRGPAYILSCLF